MTAALARWRIALVLWAVIPSVSVAGRAAPPARVRIVVPFGPGGASDSLARPLAVAMGRSLKVQIVVENRPGAAGTRAVNLAAQEPADGRTWLMGTVATHAINETAYARALRVRPSQAFVPVGLIGATPSVLVGSTRFPPVSLEELVRHVSKHPGRVTYWVPGIASGPHFDLLRIERRHGLRMVAVPYPQGASAGVNALLAGEVDVGMLNAGIAAPLVKAGRLKAYAVSSPSRLAELPDVPTAEEAGIPGGLSAQWHALFVRKETPQPTVAMLHQALADALKTEAVRLALARTGTLSLPSLRPEEAQAFVQAETARWRHEVESSRIKLR